MNKKQVAELLYQALETEQGGVKVYETALRCVVNEDLRKEWEEYLEQTRTHVDVVLGVFEALKLDPHTERSREGAQGAGGQSSQRRVRSGGKGGGPAPLPHHGLVPRALDRITRDARGLAATRGREGRQDCYWGRAGQASSARDALNWASALVRSDERTARRSRPSPRLLGSALSGTQNRMVAREATAAMSSCDSTGFRM